MRIGLLSDTHGFLDDAVLSYFSQCDELWHAGDVGSSGVLSQLREFRPTRAVYGNVDGPELRAELALDLVWDCEGLRVYMTHIGGYPGRYDKRALKEIRSSKPGLFICGHSHILRITRDPELGLIHLNPGACGHQGWHKERTLLRFTIESGQISELEKIDIGPRGRPVQKASRPAV